MGFKDKFNALIDAGTAVCLQQQLDSYYRNGPDEGWFNVYQKPR